MFGYVNVFKDELKIKDYDTYKAYYCGLCKTIGKNHNQLARFGLNYDFTFLAIFLDSLSETEPVFAKEGCLKKFGKKKIVKANSGLTFAADMNVIFSYYKLKDDIDDSGNLKFRFAILPFKRRAKKIIARYPELCKNISDSLLRLKFLEETKCDICYKVAHEFANVMKHMFAYYDESISDFGYELGKLIYLMDAYDDMEKDFKENNYNPAIMQYNYQGDFNDELKSQVSDSLYFTLAEIADIYKNICIVRNKSILDNIIYLGLRAKCDMIINQCNLRKEIKNEKSL